MFLLFLPYFFLKKNKNIVKKNAPPSIKCKFHCFLKKQQQIINN